MDRSSAILEASAPRTEAALRETAERLRAVADSLDDELRAILTPGQQRRLDALRREPTFVIKRKTAGQEPTVDTLRRRSPEP